MIIGFPHRPGSGGPGTFQINFIEFIKHDHKIVYPDDNIIPDIIIVVAGTSNFKWLNHCKKGGSLILHRLDGINWLHKKKPYLIRNYIYAEFLNWVCKRIRNSYADLIVYQSEFSKNWWFEKYGNTKVSHKVILNGANTINLQFKSERIAAKNIICVEGSIPDTIYSYKLLEYLNCLVDEDASTKVKVIGKIEKRTHANIHKFKNIEFIGNIERERVSELLINSDLFVSLELMPACPNSVIEAINHGLPVIGYNTGSIHEIIQDAGIVLPLSIKEIETSKVEMEYEFFKNSVNKIFLNYELYFDNVKKRINYLSIDQMMRGYLNAINYLNSIKNL